MKKYPLEKKIFTQDDYEQMNWHDVKIHALGTLETEHDFYSEIALVFDIDYMLEWVHIPPENRSFSFWIAPCTLVFQNVRDLHWEFQQPEQHQLEYEIYQLELLAVNPQPTKCFPNYCTYDWRIELTYGGEMTFTSSGMQQWIRKAPVLSEKQSLTLAERGGISFDKKTF